MKDSTSHNMFQGTVIRLRCKPGDLAYIVNCDTPENNGRVVEVVSLRPDGQWHIRAQGAPITVYFPQTGRSGKHNEGLAADRFLRPISGLSLDDDEATHSSVGNARRSKKARVA